MNDDVNSKPPTIDSEMREDREDKIAGWEANLVPLDRSPVILLITMSYHDTKPTKVQPVQPENAFEDI